MKPQEFVSHLREKLEYNYARGVDDDGALCTTIIATSSKAFMLLGIRPRKLGAAAAGNVYAFTNKQAVKALEALEETPPPKGLK